MRTRLASLLREFTSCDPNLYILSGDHGYALFDSVRKATPGQFINVGVSEQSMVGMAAGLAKGGIRPVVYGLCSFIPIRVLEFIKMDVCYEALPVVFLGDGAGLVYSTLGASHQCAEDMAVLLPLPNIRIYSPADATELEYCFRQAMADTSGASYIRLGKSDRPAVHNESTPLRVDGGCVEVLRSPAAPVIFATGSMVSTAMELAKAFPLSVVSVPVPSMLDSSRFKELSEDASLVVTLEEHSLWGGLGSLIDRLAVSCEFTKRVHHFGLERKFTTLASTYEVALWEHGLTLSQLETRIQNVL